LTAELAERMMVGGRNRMVGNRRTTMSVVDTAKTAYDLAKNGMTVEFHEKIMQLREET
jgi:hypothetical protein